MKCNTKLCISDFSLSSLESCKSQPSFSRNKQTLQTLHQRAVERSPSQQTAHNKCNLLQTDETETEVTVMEEEEEEKGGRGQRT